MSPAKVGTIINNVTALTYLLYTVCARSWSKAFASVNAFNSPGGGYNYYLYFIDDREVEEAMCFKKWVDNDLWNWRIFPGRKSVYRVLKEFNIKQHNEINPSHCNHFYYLFGPCRLPNLWPLHGVLRVVKCIRDPGLHLFVESLPDLTWL